MSAGIPTLGCSRILHRDHVGRYGFLAHPCLLQLSPGRHLQAVLQTNIAERNNSAVIGVIEALMGIRLHGKMFAYHKQNKGSLI
jgi:hypothetical protein